MKQYIAAVLKEPNKINLENRKIRHLKPTEALIRVAYAGICGTDIAIYNGDYKVPLPLVLGHEFSGEVKTVGSDEFDHLVGKKVTVEINNTCLAYNKKRLCSACQKGLDHHCQSRTVTGIMHHDGAFAHYVIVPARNIHIIAKSISLKEAIFIEPLAAALQTFKLSPVQHDQSIIVLGAGRLGLLIGIVAKSLGAKTLLVARSDKRKKIAAAYGLDLAVAPRSKEIIRISHEWSRKPGTDFVVEATGDPNMIATAIQIVRPRGTVALKSTPGVPASNFDITKAVVDEIKLQGSRCGDFAKAIKFYEQNNVSFSNLIEEILPLHKIKKAFSLAQSASKILINCCDV
jgi:2-desacetyl-2-hydroxyethyl bacteriochlorophyllide A dehydrogenase